MNKIFKKLILITFTIISFTLFLLGCGNKSVNTASENASNSKKVPVLKLAGGDWGAPNPYQTYPRGPGTSKVNLIFDSLIEKDEKGIIPWLAEKWQVKDGGKEYLFTVRKGVKWQDGKDLTAEDIKFTFDYCKKHPPVSNRLYINGKCCIDKVDVVDGNVVKIQVNTINAASLENLGGTKIIPKHIWEKVEDPKKFNDKEAFIGCGPYTLDSYSKEKGTYKFNAFKDYWGPKQRVESVEFVPVSDEVLAFEKGEIDTVEVKPDIAKRYEDNKDYKLIKGNNFFGYRLCMNMEKRPELKDKNVRQALAYSIDQKEILDKIMRGLGAEASAAYLPQDHIWYNKNVKKYNYDTEKAKMLLSDKPLSFEVTISNRKQELRMAELLKLQMAKSGITLNIKSVDMKTRDAATKSGQYELLITEHGGWGADADSLRNLYRSKDVSLGNGVMNAIPGYKNDDIDKLCDDQMKEMTAEKRKEIVFKLQEKIAEEVPIIPIINTTNLSVFKPSKYDGYMNMYDHFCVTHSKLTYLERK